MNLIFIFIAFPFFLELIIKYVLGISDSVALVAAILMPISFSILLMLFEKKLNLLKSLYLIMIYLPVFINISHIFLFNSEISCGSFMAMFETNIQESLEFFEHFISLNFILFSMFYWLICGTLYKFSSKLNLKKVWNKKILIAIFSILYLIFCFGDQRYKFPFEKIFFTYLEYKIDSIKNRNTLENRANFKFENIKSFIDQNEKELYVIVIGESANKDHMSLYGSEQKTTPKFDSIKDELHVFNNVNSKYCTTFKAMKTILFFNEKFQDGDLITFFKQAGFKTFWLSNQFLLENNDNISAIVSKLVDKKEFINKAHYRTKLSSNYDEELIKHFQKAVEDKASKKVIFIHLMGSHFKYSKRYPAKFQVFKSFQNDKRSNEIAEYNNSILYTDYVLYQFLSILKSADLNSFLLYFSDHGEDITDDPKSPHTHIESLSTKAMFEIPFIVWTSKRYEVLNQNFIQGWNTEKEYNTENIIHSIINLSRLSCSEYNDSKSIFNENR